MPIKYEEQGTLSKKNCTIKEPTIYFGEWKRWCKRSATKDYPDCDVPHDFDVSGIYLLAHFKNKRQKENNKNGQLHLNPNIIYIGKSKKVTKRLEGVRHEKVKEDYKVTFDDPTLKYLHYSICHQHWTTWDFEKKEGIGKALNACLLYHERKLIWEFAKVYGRIPLLNKE